MRREEGIVYVLFLFLGESSREGAIGSVEARHSQEGRSAPATPGSNGGSRDSALARTMRPLASALLHLERPSDAITKGEPDAAGRPNTGGSSARRAGRPGYNADLAGP